jgi:heme/copper-type cytochrome/quinol oxidase subunit 2
VAAINHIEYWLLFVLGWAVAIFMIWAFVDCASRKAAAFPAAGKLTKPAWMLLTGIPAVIAAVIAITGVGTVMNLLIYMGLIATSVYMADVRPAVREISGGPSRW